MRLSHGYLLCPQPTAVLHIVGAQEILVKCIEDTSRDLARHASVLTPVSSSGGVLQGKSLNLVLLTLSSPRICDNADLDSLCSGT